MAPDDVLSTYVGAFVDELARSGLRHVCICPGSRSTAPAMLFAQHPDIRVWMHLDERSAAFFAVGIAKGLREPAAVLSTSGTAAANFLPAVVEARYGRVPLLVLTADRPHELQEVGAAQTIDQSHLYGAHPKWFVDAALPEPTESAVQYVRTLADRAVAIATAAPSGPVHLNFPFREPLIPAPLELSPARKPQVAVHESPRVARREVVQTLVADLVATERGIIVCGPQDDPALPAAVARLGRALGYPVLADPLSLVRCGSHSAGVLGRYDAFLRDTALTEGLVPDIVIRIGAIPTSKPLNQFLQRCRCRHILVDTAGWNDPIAAATDIVHADPASLVASLADAIPTNRSGSPWVDCWQTNEALTSEAIADALECIEEPFEGKIFAELEGLLPDGAILWAGSSMPVRDMDSFFPPTQRSVRFLANRGANGIDGVVSSALGASIAGPLVLVIGDLSFYHDMNGLLAAKLHGLDVTIVLVNNDGGGIFSFLPQAGTADFEMLFGTPHSLNFRPAAEIYDARFERVTTWHNFRIAVQDGIASTGLSIVEVPTERERNVELHRTIWRRVAEILTAEGVPA